MSAFEAGVVGAMEKIALFGIRKSLREGGAQAGDEFRRQAMPRDKDIEKMRGIVSREITRLQGRMETGAKRAVRAAGQELPDVVRGALKKTWLPIAGTAGAAGLALGLGAALGNRLVPRRPDPSTYYRPMETQPSPLMPAGAPDQGRR